MDKLCEQCEDILQTAWVYFEDTTLDDKEKIRSLEPSDQTRKNASELSCDICSLLWRDRGTNLTALIPEDPTVMIYLRYLAEDSLVILWLQPRVAYDDTACRNPVTIARKTSKNSLSVTPEPEISSTFSPQLIKSIQTWLTKCTEKHSSCKNTQLRQQLPGRLIDLNPGDKNWKIAETEQDMEDMSILNEPLVRICSTEGMSATQTNYLTLSHCWGQGPVVSLTQQTEASFRVAVPQQALLHPGARVFCDAIKISRSLGFRYLWIDALCIVQDDDEDRFREVALMHVIYSYCAINLSATAARDGRGAMIFERKKRTLTVTQASLKPQHAEFGIHCDRFDAYSDYWSDAIQNSPVVKRGWIFQERTLSPRVLHFTKNQVYWECCDLEASEFHTSRRSKNDSWPWSFKDRIGLLQSGYSRRGRSRQVWEEHWLAIVARYSASKTKYSEDRLVAFSAIARSVCQSNGFHPGTYAAGCWRPLMVQCLRWRAESTTLPSKPQFYRAPSWSWASIEGGVIYDDTCWDPSGMEPEPDTDHELADVGLVSIELKTDDPFGEVSGGHVRLQCYLCSAPYQDFAGLSTAHCFVQLVLVKGSLSLHVCESSSLEVYFDGVLQITSATGLRTDTANDLIYFAPLVQNKLGHKDLFDGLVLQRTLVKGQYRRLGMFKYHLFHRSKGSGKVSFPGLWRTGQGVGDSDFIERSDVDSRYLIEII